MCLVLLPQVESDEETYAMCLDDTELVRFPVECINGKVELVKVQGLPDNLYFLSEGKGE
jgi:hypothetical protein